MSEGGGVELDEEEEILSGRIDDEVTRIGSGTGGVGRAGEDCVNVEWARGSDGCPPLPASFDPELLPPLLLLPDSRTAFGLD